MIFAIVAVRSWPHRFFGMALSGGCVLRPWDAWLPQGLRIMHSASYTNPSIRTHSDTSPAYGWGLEEESCRQATGRRASHRVILGILGMHRRLSWSAVGLVCGPVQRKHQERYARHVTVDILISPQFLQIP